ncbi:1071_t:CDS:1, partial [Acaulospora morrowiae]
MTTAYLQPLVNPKRVKLISTCDTCKTRKVKCDKERPECGTCRKTNRKCSYSYAYLTETMRHEQSGTKQKSDSIFLQKQLDCLQKIQFGQLDEESGYLSVASRGLGVDVNDSQNVLGML